MILVGENALVGPWICKRTGGEWTGQGQTLGIAKDGALIAGVMYEQHNGNSIVIHVAAEGSRWMSRDFLYAVFAYPFIQLKVQKLIGPVDSTNFQARKFDEHLGFHLEATLKNAGRAGDLLLYTMTPEQCRFIGGRYGRKVGRKPATD